MKRILAFCLAAVMLLTLAACGQDVPQEDQADGNSSYQVGEPNVNDIPENDGTPDIAPKDDLDGKSSQTVAEPGEANLPGEDDARGTAATNTASGMSSDNKIKVSEIAPKADSQGSADGEPDIAPEDDPNAGTNKQIAEQILIDLPAEDDGELNAFVDTADRSSNHQVDELN